MSTSTASWRFYGGSLNADWRKIATNIISSPIQHHFVTSFVNQSMITAKNDDLWTQLTKVYKYASFCFVFFTSSLILFLKI